MGRVEQRGRDMLALRIEQRLEELEAAESWEQLAARHQQRQPEAMLAAKVTDYKAEAARLGAIPMTDPDRGRAHVAYQATGDA